MTLLILVIITFDLLLSISNYLSYHFKSASVLPYQHLSHSYFGENSCIRLFPRSTTKTFPEESTTMPVGSLNCPLP